MDGKKRKKDRRRNVIRKELKGDEREMKEVVRVIKKEIRAEVKTEELR